jgi:hypothetical protein
MPILIATLMSALLEMSDIFLIVIWPAQGSQWILAQRDSALRPPGHPTMGICNNYGDQVMYYLTPNNLDNPGTNIFHVYNTVLANLIAP